MGRSTSRSQWTRHLSCGSGGSKLSVTRAQQEVVRQGRPFAGVVMGIDPSLRGTGLALVDWDPAGRASLIASETLRLHPKLLQSECLGEIALAVKRFAREGKPVHAAIEETIYVQNFQTAQILGAARGAAIGMLASEGVPVFEYAPLSIKQAVVGFGRARKEQVGKTILQLCQLKEMLPSDESDAAATALCHAMTYRYV